MLQMITRYLQAALDVWCEAVSQINIKCWAIGGRGEADRQTPLNPADGETNGTEGLMNGLQTDTVSDLIMVLVG